MEMLSATEVILTIWGTVVSLLCSYYYAKLHEIDTASITPSQLHRLIRTDPELRAALRRMIDALDRPTS